MKISVLQCLIWVYTVCLCTQKRISGLYVFTKLLFNIIFFLNKNGFFKNPSFTLWALTRAFFTEMCDFFLKIRFEEKEPFFRVCTAIIGTLNIYAML